MIASLGVGVVAGILIHSWRTPRGRAAAGPSVPSGAAGQPPAGGPVRREADLRAAHAEGCRRSYRQLCAEARGAVGADAESWKRAQAALDRHFAPMEEALGAFLKSSSWQPPDVRRTVAPQVPAVLEELRAALGPEAWAKFDAWRRPKENSPEVWRQPRSAYFLLPEEYQAVTAAAAAALRWNMAEPAIRRLCAELALPVHKEEELRATLRDHLVRYSAAAGGPGAPRPAGADARVREALELTDEKLRALLGEEQLKAYAAWKAALAPPARDYFNPPAPPAAGTTE
jgi:hypothetical protein